MFCLDLKCLLLHLLRKLATKFISLFEEGVIVIDGKGVNASYDSL